MRNLLSALAAALFAVAVPAASAADPLPMVYEAVSLATPPGQAQTTIAVMPRSVGLSFPRAGTPEPQAVQTIFEAMKTRFPAAYGSTTISITQARGTVTINLDPALRDNWRLVLAELFFTLKSFGFVSVAAPLFSSAPLDASVIDAVVALPTQPWWRAVGPDFAATPVVTIDGTRLMTTESFRKGLSEGNADLVRILASGLRSPDDAVRLASVGGLTLARAPEVQALAPVLARDALPAVRLAVVELSAAGRVTLADADLIRLANEDTDPDIRLAAARQLAGRGNHDFDHVLELSNLQSLDPAIVIASLKRLRSSTRSDLAPVVAAILSSPSPEARAMAVEILGRFRAAGVMSRYLASGGLPADVYEPLAIGIVNICPMDESALFWMARSGGTDTASRALAAACNPEIATQPAECGKGAQATAVLAACAGRSEPVLREKAVECLGRLSDPAALDTLMPLMSDAAIGRQAAGAAARVMSRQPQSGLVGLVNGSARPGGDRRMRLLALEAIAMLPAGSMEPGTILALKTLMKDPDIEIRRAVVNALARSGDSAVLPAVLAGIDDTDEGIRRAAVVAAAGMSGPEADAVIRKSLEDLSTPVKIAGLEALSTRTIPDTRNRIRMLAGNARPEVRRPAVIAYLKTLTPAEDSLIFPFASPLLYDSDETVRITAVEAMRDLTDSEAANAIGALVIDQSPRVRAAVATVLGRMRSNVALGYLRKEAADVDPGVRRAVVEALGRFRLEDSGPILRDMASREKDPGIRTMIDALLAQ